MKKHFLYSEHAKMSNNMAIWAKRFVELESFNIISWNFQFSCNYHSDFSVNPT